MLENTIIFIIPDFTEEEVKAWETWDSRARVTNPGGYVPCLCPYRPPGPRPALS